jgi:hypothetical protein
VVGEERCCWWWAKKRNQNKKQISKKEKKSLLTHRIKREREREKAELKFCLFTLKRKIYLQNFQKLK